jgi:flagellar hook-associated protein 2
MSQIGSIVTALGGGSGVDMIALANNLASAQFALRNDRLVLQSEQLERQISAASSIKNSLSLLASALGDRVRTGDLAARPTVANASVATAVNQLGAIGSGTYSLEVLALAQSQTLASSSFASSNTVVGGGTLTIRFGATGAGSFAEDAAKLPLSVEVPAGGTLAQIASAINAKGGSVRAYVAQTEQGAQLVLKGQDGTQNGFIVEASETLGDEGLATLAWDPTQGGDPARLTSTSANASFKLDGLAMTRPSNDTGLVAPGISLKLTGTNAGAPTRISFTSPIGNITEAMNDFVSALNEVAGGLRMATDPMSGDLARDPGARELQRMLSQLGGQIVMPNAPAGAPRTLADLGLALQRDGTFRLDAPRLAAVLERDPAGTAAMFTPGLFGVFATFDKLARSATSTGNPVSLAGSINRYQKQSHALRESSAKLAEQQETLRANLVSRFAKADTRISSSKSTLTFLQAQIDAWNRKD